MDGPTMDSLLQESGEDAESWANFDPFTTQSQEQEGEEPFDPTLYDGDHGDVVHSAQSRRISNISNISGISHVSEVEMARDANNTSILSRESRISIDNIAEENLETEKKSTLENANENLIGNIDEQMDYGDLEAFPPFDEGYNENLEAVPIDELDMGLKNDDMLLDMGNLSPAAKDNMNKENTDENNVNRRNTRTSRLTMVIGEKNDNHEHASPEQLRSSDTTVTTGKRTAQKNLYRKSKRAKYVDENTQISNEAMKIQLKDASHLILERIRPRDLHTLATGSRGEELPIANKRLGTSGIPFVSHRVENLFGNFMMHELNLKNIPKAPALKDIDEAIPSTDLQEQTHVEPLEELVDEDDSIEYARNAENSRRRSSLSISHQQMDNNLNVTKDSAQIESEMIGNDGFYNDDIILEPITGDDEFGAEDTNVINEVEMEDPIQEPSEDEEKVNEENINKEEAPLQVQWHPNTLKILKFLRRQMKNKKEISFSSISKGIKRRTAAACFFELLQLKTWGFIELNQDSAYDSISISAASRFYDEVNVAV